jgi:hypothetical protein
MNHKILLSVFVMVLLSVCAMGQGQKIMTFAGTGFAGHAGDGFSAGAAELSGPSEVAFDNSGNVYILDFWNFKIRKVAPNSIITTVAGTGIAGNSGNGTIATSADIAPQGMAIDWRYNIFFSDKGEGLIRRVNKLGIISHFAGGGTTGLQLGYSGDGGKADTARFRFPTGVAVDDTGNLFIADAGNHVIRKIDTFGFIHTVAGSNVSGYSGDGGDALLATLDSPYAVIVDHKGNLYINDFRNNVIRKVDAATKVITTVVGTGAYSLTGDNGPATAATINQPRGLAVDTANNLYIADANNNVIRKVDTGGIITTVAGNGTYGYGGDYGYALGANLFNPYGVAVNKNGNIFIADANNQRVRMTYATTGVNNIATADESVFPNPFTSNITVHGLSVSDKVAVLDMTGRPVSQTWEVKTSGPQTFSITNLAAGMYMLQVWDDAGNKKAVTKLVKE